MQCIAQRIFVQRYPVFFNIRGTGVATQRHPQSNTGILKLHYLRCTEHKASGTNVKLKHTKASLYIQ